MAKHGNLVFEKKRTIERKAHERHVRLARLFSCVILLLLAFLAGFVVRGHESFLISMGIPIHSADGGQAASAASTKTTYDSVAMRVSEVEDILSEKSLDSYDIDELTNLVLSAYSDASNDKYLTYYTPGRYASYASEAAQGEYSGIGVLFSEYEGRAYAIDVFEGSSAQAHGVQQGDYLVAVDGDSSHDWSMTEAINAVSRAQDETVVTTWLHPSAMESEAGQTFTVTLTCSEYSEQNVSSSLEGSVGVIKIRQFTQDSSESVKNAIDNLGAAGATSYVIDVRDNPGGYLSQALDTANLFLKSGVLLEVQTVDGVTAKTASGAAVTNAPIAVLANGYTSAAAEVFVAALQDNQRATVVGETTSGKGSVQVVKPLSFGGALRYTAAYYLTPLGHDILGVGVLPDVSVGSGGDSTTDAQLSVAIETASLMVS